MNRRQHNSSHGLQENVKIEDFFDFFEKDVALKFSQDEA